MEYSKAVKHRYNVDNLYLDAGERAALKKALPGNGEGWFDIYEYANAWAESLLLDGDPLNTRVNVETDTDAWETDASKINRYLEDNDWEPTLNNVAAAFIYTETDFSQLDINLQGKEYRVTRIDAVHQYTGDGQGRGGGYTKIITVAPGWDEYPNFDFYGTTPADVEGEEHKAANARAISYYEPDNVAALGGILMERITD